MPPTPLGLAFPSFFQQLSLQQVESDLLPTPYPKPALKKGRGHAFHSKNNAHNILIFTFVYHCTTYTWSLPAASWDKPGAYKSSSQALARPLPGLVMGSPPLAQGAQPVRRELSCPKVPYTKLNPISTDLNWTPTRGFWLDSH